MMIIWSEDDKATNLGAFDLAYNVKKYSYRYLHSLVRTDKLDS